MAEAEIAFASIPIGWLESGCLELDVGCHRGGFLVEAAKMFPERLFLGIERLTDRVLRANAKIQRLGLKNALALRAEGKTFLSLLPENSLQAIHVLFPDPWPKRRHANRRMVDEQFLSASTRCLKFGGLFRFLSDDQNYIKVVEKLASKLLQPLEIDNELPEFPESEFQKKFRSTTCSFRQLLFSKQHHKSNLPLSTNSIIPLSQNLN